MAIKPIQIMQYHCVKSAYDSGARWIVLCDTNGGTLPHEVTKIVAEVSKTYSR